MAASDKPSDESLYPIAVLIDELKNEDIQVSNLHNFFAIKIFVFYKWLQKKKYGDKILVIAVDFSVDVYWNEFLIICSLISQFVSYETI